jgi:hypothetical protein
MEHFDYFPSRVYRDERPDLVQQVLHISEQYLDQVRNKNSLFSQSSNLGREYGLRQFSDYLLLSTNNILREQGYQVEKYDFYVSGLWAQEIVNGGSTVSQIYKNSQICGWFFLELPKTDISVIYQDTRLNKNMIELDFIQNDNITFATNTICFNNLKLGTVLFSNSWMEQKIISNETDSPTKCIHFTISHRDILCNIY